MSARDDSLFPIARAFLTLNAAFLILACAIMSYAMLAGPKPHDNPIAVFAIMVGTLLVIHGGYLLAPLCLGHKRSSWVFWMMFPVAGINGLGALDSLRHARDQSSPIEARHAMLLGFVVLVYITPLVLVRYFQPRAATPAFEVAP